MEKTSFDQPTKTSVETCFKNLIGILEESHHFIQKFTDASIIKQCAKSSTYRDKFEELNTALLCVTNDLNLGLNISSIFAQNQDQADQHADIVEISSKLDLIAIELHKQQQMLSNHHEKMEKEFDRRFHSIKYHLQEDLRALDRPASIPQNEQKDLPEFPLIPAYDLVMEEQIGCGGFANVYRGRWVSHHHRVAIKQIRMAHLDAQLKNDFFQEISTMYKIRFDYVLGIFGAAIESDYYALVLEYMSLGSLFDVLAKQQIVFTWPDRWNIALQMAKGLHYLHMMSIIHRDIKSLNFLLDQGVNGYIVKISDFGLAKIRYETNRQTTNNGQQQRTGGTLQWTAPELLSFSKPSKASDIYSLAIVFWELASGCQPYEHVDPAVILQGVCNGQRLEIPEDVPSSFASIITRSWSQDPKQRPTSEALLGEITEKINSTSNAVAAKEAVHRNHQLEDTIQKCPSSSTIKLDSQNISDADIDIVVQEALIKKQPCDLWLSNNQITSKGAQTLANALYSNATLSELWLSGNQLSDQGVSYLAEALSINVSLKKLGLSSNQITNRGVEHLVQMLQVNRTLIMLGLARNRIEDQSVQLLASTLAYRNSTLQVLTLNRNPSITDASVPSLINMINKSRSVRELWINDCQLTDSGKRRLQDTTKLRKDLKIITVYDQPS